MAATAESVHFCYHLVQLVTTSIGFMSRFQAKRYAAGSKEHCLVDLKPNDNGLMVRSKNSEETLAYANLELKPVGFMDCLTILYDRRSENTFISTDTGLLAGLKKFTSGPLHDQVCIQHSQKQRERFYGVTGWSVVSIIWLTYNGLRTVLLKLFRLVAP
jgi:hypothetical protein